MTWRGSAREVYLASRRRGREKQGKERTLATIGGSAGGRYSRPKNGGIRLAAARPEKRRGKSRGQVFVQRKKDERRHTVTTSRAGGGGEKFTRFAKLGAAISHVERAIVSKKNTDEEKNTRKSAILAPATAQQPLKQSHSKPATKSCRYGGTKCN